MQSPQSGWCIFILCCHKQKSQPKINSSGCGQCPVLLKSYININCDHSLLWQKATRSATTLCLRYGYNSHVIEKIKCPIILKVVELKGHKLKVPGNQNLQESKGHRKSKANKRDLVYSLKSRINPILYENMRLIQCII